MNDRRHLAALLGFAFVAAWIGFGFGEAILCLLGAGLFAAGVAVVDGQLDLGALQSRLGGQPDAAAPSYGPRPTAPGGPRPPRVR